MVDRRERDNGSGAGVEPQSTPPRCALASRLALVAAGRGADAVVTLAAADEDAGTVDALRGAAKWLDAKPVRKDLAILAERVSGLSRAAFPSKALTDCLTDIDAHTRELLVVAFASGYGSGAAAGHKTGRGDAATEAQVAHLSQAERQNYQAIQTRDARIREELGALLGMLEPSVAGSKIVPSWERLLAALDTMKSAARMVAHMFGGSK